MDMNTVEVEPVEVEPVEVEPVESLGTKVVTGLGNSLLFLGATIGALVMFALSMLLGAIPFVIAIFIVLWIVGV